MMGRPLRAAAGGVIYHVLNRANARAPIFRDPGDFNAFVRVLDEASARVAMRILAYCLMPNHWHLVLWPRQDGDLSDFMRWATLTHTQRWHAYRGSAGNGHLYQGRFKSFPVQTDEHFLSVCRYVERNPMRAGIVVRAEHWRWSSLRTHAGHSRRPSVRIAPWPVERPRDWIDRVNAPQSATELEAIRHSVRRGRPFGLEAWVEDTVERLGLHTTLRRRGRPALELTSADLKGS